MERQNDVPHTALTKDGAQDLATATTSDLGNEAIPDSLELGHLHQSLRSESDVSPEKPIERIVAGHDQMVSRLLKSAVNGLPNSQLMDGAVGEIYNWAWMDLLCNWLEQGGEPKQLDEILGRFPESLIREEENQDQHQESLEFYRDLGLRMAGQKQTEWRREQLLSSAKNKQWDQLRKLSGQWINWLVTQQNLSPNTACEFRSLLFSATSKLTEIASHKPCQVLLNDINPSHFDEVLATSFHSMNLAQFEAPATIVAFRYLYDYFMELDLVKKSVRDKTFVTLDKLEKDVNRATEGHFGFLPRYQNNTLEATTENIV